MASALGQVAPLGVAPDGEIGFGRAADLRAIEKVWRSPSPEQAAVLDGWREASRSLDWHERRARLEDDARGYLDLALCFRGLDFLLGEGDLDTAIQLLAFDPFPLSFTPQQALVFVDFLGDARRAARQAILREARFEARQQTLAFALLDSHTFGSGRQEEPASFEVLTQRADLAASRLRALLRDLDALLPKLPGHEVRVYSAEEMRLAQALCAHDRTAGLAFSERIAKTARDKEELLGGSHGAAHDRLLAPLLAAREQALTEAAKAQAELLPLMADAAERGVLQPQAAGRLDSLRAALTRALQGLLHDPLNAELNRQAGLLTEALQGRPLAVRFYDRSLHLRGIRSYDDWTVTGRLLSIEEKDCLARLLPVQPPPGTR